jgi:hypothetical protein
VKLPLWHISATKTYKKKDINLFLSTNKLEDGLKIENAK